MCYLDCYQTYSYHIIPIQVKNTVIIVITIKVVIVTMIN